MHFHVFTEILDKSIPGEKIFGGTIDKIDELIADYITITAGGQIDGVGLGTNSLPTDTSYFSTMYVDLWDFGNGLKFMDLFYLDQYGQFIMGPNQESLELQFSNPFYPEFSARLSTERYSFINNNKGFIFGAASPSLGGLYEFHGGDLYIDTAFGLYCGSVVTTSSSTFADPTYFYISGNNLNGDPFPQDFDSFFADYRDNVRTKVLGVSGISDYLTIVSGLSDDIAQQLINIGSYNIPSENWKWISTHPEGLNQSLNTGADVEFNTIATDVGPMRHSKRIDGLLMINIGNNLYLQHGRCLDDSENTLMVWSGTKSGDIANYYGTGSGKIAAGISIPLPIGLYHVFVMSNSNGANVNWAIDDDLSHSNLSADANVTQTQFRRVLTFYIYSSGNITTFKCFKDKVLLDWAALQANNYLNVGSGSWSQIVPGLFPYNYGDVIPIFDARISLATANPGYYAALIAGGDMSPAPTDDTKYSHMISGYMGTTSSVITKTIEIATNASSEIYVKKANASDVGNMDLQFRLIGWSDLRRQYFI